jgi:glycosyltransferase involved in cell wall biosynthesis
MPYMSLVIPCYNEAKNLPDLIKRCEALIKQADIEIILVDNGSSDDTQNILKSLKEGAGIRSTRVEVNQGYGFGILSGLRIAHGDFIGWTHADLQTDVADAIQAINIFKQNPNRKTFVKGKRYGRAFFDVVFTTGMSCFETILFGIPFWDINAQPTLFPRELFSRWKNPPHDFALDLYAYWSAQRYGCVIKRFPVRFGLRRHGTISTWNINWLSKFKMIQRVAGYSWQLRRKFVE